MTDLLSYQPDSIAAPYSTKGAPTIKKFLLDQSPVQAIMGPFGSGKSVACVMKCLLLAQQIPPMPDGVRRTRFGVVRNTYPQLRDTTQATLFEWLPPARWGKFQKDEHRYVIDAFDGYEIEFLFRALDRPDHVQNLLSLELTHGWGNEARELPREVIGPLRGRLGRYPRRSLVGDYQRVLMFDTNPPDTDSWFYELFEERRPDGAVLFKQPGGRTLEAENRINLPSDYYEDMANTMSDEEIKVYIDAQYGYLSTGKPVYPEYRDSWHCAEFDVKPRSLLLCWDFGLTPACVVLQLQADGQVRMIDEVVADRAGIQAFAPRVLAHLKQQYPWAMQEIGSNFTQADADRWRKHIGDPAGEASSQTDELSCFDIMRGVGIDCWPGNQDPVLRLESVRYLLSQAIDGKPGLLIHPRCKRTRKGFQGEYQYRRVLVGGSNARFAEKPDKNKYSHPHDALQYGAVDLVGDRVMGLESRLARLGGGQRLQTKALSEFDPLAEIKDDPVDGYDDFYSEQGDAAWQQHAY